MDNPNTGDLLSLCRSLGITPKKVKLEKFIIPASARDLVGVNPNQIISDEDAALIMADMVFGTMPSKQKGMLKPLIEDSNRELWASIIIARSKWPRMKVNAVPLPQ